MSHEGTEFLLERIVALQKEIEERKKAMREVKQIIAIAMIQLDNLHNLALNVQWANQITRYWV